MIMQEMKEKIREFLGRYIEEDYSDDEDFYLMGYVNSLFAMQLVVFLEQEFDISVENEDLEIKNFSSVDNIAKFIQTKME